MSNSKALKRIADNAIGARKLARSARDRGDVAGVREWLGAVSEIQSIAAGKGIELALTGSKSSRRSANKSDGLTRAERLKRKRAALRKIEREQNAPA